MADIGEEPPAGVIDPTQGLVGPAKLLGALGDGGFEIVVRVLQSLLVRLQVVCHAVEALPELGKLIATRNGDTVREVALGKLARALQQLGQRCAQTSQQSHDERERDENSQRSVNLADALEPAQELRGVSVDAE